MKYPFEHECYKFELHLLSEVCVEGEGGGWSGGVMLQFIQRR